MLSLYVPGASPLHRAPAGYKLAGLAVLLAGLGLWRSPWATGLGAALVVAGVLIAGFGPAPLWRQLRPVAWLLAVLAALQWLLVSGQAALVVAGSLLVSLAAAALVTATTRVAELLEAVVRAVRPLRRFGVDPERVGLTLALTLRAVPVVAVLAREVLQARAARGAQRSVRAFAVPLTIRTVRYADRLGEALVARGVDDPDPDGPADPPPPRR